MVGDYLHEFLNVYWLRPENALWRTVNANAMNEIKFSQPSLDVSCGDGVFSFINAGGAFDISFDIFNAVHDLDEFYENADIYNHAPDEYDPEIASRPDYNFTVGTDWKPELLEKADTLDFYEELHQHDNNEPLPFEDGRFDTVFTNSAYWVDNLQLHLSEIERVIDDECGKAILVLKTESVHSLLDWLSSHPTGFDTGWLEMLERGRRTNHMHLFDDPGWTEILNEAGLNIRERYPQITQVHAGFWDIGLRPVSPQLIQMAQAVPDGELRDIKKAWIHTLARLLKPFCEPGIDMGLGGPPAEIIYVVESA